MNSAQSRIVCAKARALITAWLNSGAEPRMSALAAYDPIIALGIKRSALESVVWRMTEAGLISRVKGVSPQDTYYTKNDSSPVKPKEPKP